MTARFLLAALVLAATASPALAQKPADRGSSEQASGEARGSAAMGWYKVATANGTEMVQGMELGIETAAGGESSFLTLDGKTGEIDLLKEISFHGLGDTPNDGSPIFSAGEPVAYDSKDQSKTTTNNPDGSTTTTVSETTSKTNPDGSTTTTVSSSSTTTHPDGSTEETDVVVVRTSPPPRR